MDADDLEGARKLLKSGADANALTERGISPLSLAVANGNAAMVELLLKAGAKADQQRAHRRDPADAGRAGGRARRGASCCCDHGADVNARDPHFGQTALMFAARAGHAGIVVDAACPRAQTRTWRRSVGDPPAFVEAQFRPGYGFGIGIIRGGMPADRGRRDAATGGMTAMHYAARQDHADVWKLLREGRRRRSIAREANDITPLLMAISNNNMAAAQYPARARRRRERAGLVWPQPVVGSRERAQSLRAQRHVQERHRPSRRCSS